MQIYFSLLVALIGGVIYVMSDNPKASELGRGLWWMGWLAFLLQGVPHLAVLGR